MFSSLKRALKINDLGFFNLNTPQLPSFNFEQFKHHGLPPTISCVSFDHLGVLVIGTEDGILKIDGDTISGSETTLVSAQKEKIIFAEIISDKGYAIALTEHSIELWNVNTRQLVSRKKLEFTVTSVSSTTPQKISSATSLHFIYVGDDRGNVCLIKCSETDIFLSQPLNFDEKPLEKKNPILGLAINPKKEEELLVAFASGRVIICNMRSKEIIVEYDFSLPENHNALLSCVCWLPSGLQFVCGYTNGFLAISSKKKQSSDESDHPAKPKRFFLVNDNNLEDSMQTRTPIRRISSGQAKAGYFLVILGGSLTREVKSDLFLVSNTKHGIGSTKRFSTSMLCGTSIDSTTKDFALYSSNSDSFLMIATNNGLTVMQLGSSSKLPAEEVFCHQGVFLLQNDPAYKFISVEPISQATVATFVNSMKKKVTASLKWPIIGGRDPNLQNVDEYKIMASCHESGVLRFWVSGKNLAFWECVGETDLNATNTITVNTILQSDEGARFKQQTVSQTTERIVTSLQVVDVGGLFVFVGCLNGDTIILDISAARNPTDATFLIEMPTDITHGQANALLDCTDKVPSVGHWDFRLHGQATEYQIGVIRFPKPIQLIQVTSSLCVISDCDGYFALFDWSNQQFQFKAAYVSNQQLASILFSWISVVQPSTSQTQVTQRKPAIICTSQNGTCYALSITDKTILPISTEPKKGKVEFSVCVDNTGRDASHSLYFQQCFQKLSENNFAIPEDTSSQLPTLALVVVSQTEIMCVILEYPVSRKFKIDLRTPVQHAGLLSTETEKQQQEPSSFLFVIQSEPQTVISILQWDGTTLCRKELVGCRLFAHDKILSYRDGNIVFLLSNASVMTTNIFASSICDRVGCHLEPTNIKLRKNSDSKSFFQQLKKLTTNTTEDNQTGVDYDSYFPEQSNSNSNVGNLKAESQATENVMAKNLQALQERGEKLRNLEDKSADMANAAKDFLEMAKELKKSQQKPWYAL